MLLLLLLLPLPPLLLPPLPPLLLLRRGRCEGIGGKSERIDRRPCAKLLVVWRASVWLLRRIDRATAVGRRLPREEHAGGGVWGGAAAAAVVVWYWAWWRKRRWGSRARDEPARSDSGGPAQLRAACRAPLGGNLGLAGATSRRGRRHASEAAQRLSATRGTRVARRRHQHPVLVG